MSDKHETLWHLTTVFLDGRIEKIPVKYHFVEYIQPKYTYFQTAWTLGLCDIYYPGGKKKVTKFDLCRLYERGLIHA